MRETKEWLVLGLLNLYVRWYEVTYQYDVALWIELCGDELCHDVIF